MNVKIACLLLFCLCIPRLAIAQTELVIPLWEEGPPGFEDRRGEPERAESYWVRNVHNPTLTAYLPSQETATGAAVLVCPGGGHRELVFNAEGRDPARFLKGLGVAAFALKYRLGREPGTPYSIQDHAREDGMRAMRLLRSRAVEWGLDPMRIGMMGFSAGGEVVSMVAYGPTEGDPNAVDPIDRVSALPNFQIMIYPGPLGIPETILSDAPRAFLLVANDDRGAARTTIRLFQKLRDARVSVEFHALAQGGHAFNMGDRSTLRSVRNWSGRLEEWLADGGLLASGSEQQ